VDQDLVDRRAAIELVRVGRSPSGRFSVADSIRASWDRCQVLIEEARPNVPVRDDSVRERWEASPIRRLAPHVVAELAEAGREAGMLAIVTDPVGQVLWHDTPPDLRVPAEDVGLIPGGRWDEPVAGTNGIGMALVTRRPSVVFATEHWCTPVRDWVCYSAPVHTADGAIAGIIDLSTTWDRANPLALGTIGAMARLIDVELAAEPASAAGLAVHALGRGRVLLDGVPVALGPRQVELLVVLATVGTATLDELHGLLFGDRPISMTTLRAEISHTRAALGGAIASRPYRLTVPFRVDALDVLDRVRHGDLDGAVAAYEGQLLPTSDAPLVVERRYHLDVALRTALLTSGNTRQLLRYAAVHPWDVEVIRRAIAVAAPNDPDLPSAVAALAVATADL
jgi:hypothetical protein